MLTLRHPGGYTLAELVIAMAVLAILAAVALPNLAQAVQRGRRAEAISALMQLQLAQERWRSSHPAYAPDPASLGLGAHVADHYRLTITASQALGYTAVATAIGAQAGDASCTSLGLTLEAGRLTTWSSGRAPTTECWRR